MTFFTLLAAADAIDDLLSWRTLLKNFGLFTPFVVCAWAIYTKRLYLARELDAACKRCQEIEAATEDRIKESKAREDFWRDVAEQREKKVQLLLGYNERAALRTETAVAVAAKAVEVAKGNTA